MGALRRGQQRSCARKSSLLRFGLVSLISALLGAGVERLITRVSRQEFEDIGKERSSERMFAALAAHQNTTIYALRKIIVGLKKQEVENRIEPLGASSRIEAERSKEEEACETKFGAGLVDHYKSSKEVWCQGEEAEVECYSKKLEYNPGKTGVFCVGKNIVIDFSKVQSSSVHLKKQARGQNSYLSFRDGSTSAQCQKTKHWNHGILMNHMSAQLRTFRSENKVLDFDEYRSGTSYLMARDEDCENMFHSSADFLNAFLVGQVLNLDWKSVQVFLWDRHPNGPFFELIQKSFSQLKPIARPTDFGTKKIKFERLVFHLESPAGIIFPKVAGPKGIMRCHRSSLWLEYKNHVLASFGLLNLPPPKNPNILLTVRRRTPTKNVGRVFADESQLTKILKKGQALTYKVVDFGTISFADQLQLVRHANILIGAHGAGLMHVLFLAEEAVLLEIHPSYRLDRHFRLAARMTGKIYLPMRSLQQVSCSGSSDAIPIDSNQFEAVLDAAVRIARSFDDGVAECGLSCDPRLLALDPGAPVSPGTKALTTRFPCR